MDVHTLLDPEAFAHLRVSTMRRTHTPRYCTIPGCDGEIQIFSAGLCAAHYKRATRGMPVDVVIKRRKGRL